MGLIIERHKGGQYKTLRMPSRHFTRKTSAFSRKLTNHALAVALHFLHYSFIRIHQSLRMTPAMALHTCTT